MTLTTGGIPAEDRVQQMETKNWISVHRGSWLGGMWFLYRKLCAAKRKIKELNAEYEQEATRSDKLYDLWQQEKRLRGECSCSSRIQARLSSLYFCGK